MGVDVDVGCRRGCGGRGMVRDDELGEDKLLVCRGCVASFVSRLEERGPWMAQPVGDCHNSLGCAFACLRHILGRDILHVEEPLTGYASLSPRRNAGHGGG